MTLDEFIASAKGMPTGYLTKLAEVSGYHRNHICRIVDGECIPKHQTLVDLVASLERAAKKLKDEDKPLHFNGLACVSCGNTLRYITTSNCVTCKRQRTKKHFYKKRGVV